MSGSSPNSQKIEKSVRSAKHHRIIIFIFQYNACLIIRESNPNLRTVNGLSSDGFPHSYGRRNDVLTRDFIVTFYSLSWQIHTYIQTLYMFIQNSSYQKVLNLFQNCRLLFCYLYIYEYIFLQIFIFR